MGLFKKLRRAGGKLLKSAIKLAGDQVLGQLPLAGPIVASKLRTMGQNRTRQKLLATTDLSSGIAVKRLTPGALKGGPPPRTSPGLPALVAMRDPAARELLNNEQAKGVKSRVVGAVSNKKRAAAIWKGLDSDTRAELLKQFKADNPKGTDATWAKYVIANG